MNDLQDIRQKIEFGSSQRLAKKLEQMNRKKVLHFGSLAGWPHTVARVSRLMGVPAENVIHVYKDVLDLDRKLPYDLSIFEQGDSFGSKVIKTLNFLRDCPDNYGLVHYHSTTLLHREYHFLGEGNYLRRHGVPMVLSLGGGDARLDAEAKKRNEYYYKEPNYLHDLRIRLRWFSWSKNIAVCATEPEMAEVAADYFERIEMFHQPVELALFPFNPPSDSLDVPLILHVPTNPAIKGTDYIVRAVENLKKKGLNFNFKLVRQLSQDEFFKVLLECDVYVDELRCGGHGMTAVEAMAMGKPTITYIRDDLLDKYPEDMPLVNANPDTIESVLERLISDAALRRSIGIDSRKYVEKYHDAHVVVEKLSGIYLDLLENS